MSLHKLIKESLYSSPLFLLNFDISVVNKLLPFSIGIEIECYKSNKYDIKEFENILYILGVNCDGCEQRYRIPNGVAGIICLYLLCKKLSDYSILNEGSGIHYHVDFTDCFSIIELKKEKDDLFNNLYWVLDELNKWHYKGNYNKRLIGLNQRGGWINFQSGFRTMEVRIGEMTFNYPLMMRRIQHLSEISLKIKQQLNPKYDSNKITYPDIDVNTIIDIVNYDKLALDRYKSLEDELAIIQSQLNDNDNTKILNLANDTIKNRTVKIEY